MAGVVATITISGTAHSVYGLTSSAVADANAYFAARLGASAWTDAAVSLKNQALVTAVRFLDRGVIWSGDQTDPDTPQALQWPRDSATCRGETVTDGTIPDNIVHGEFELALALLEDESVQDSTGTGDNVKSAKAGSAKVEFFKPTAGSTQETRFPTVVDELVGCYSAGSASSSAPYVNGVNDPEHNDQDSSFSDNSTDNFFNLSQGLP